MPKIKKKIILKNSIAIFKGTPPVATPKLLRFDAGKLLRVDGGKLLRQT